MDEETRANPLILVDGSNYVYRAYYAISGLATSSGVPTNAIFGFTNMLLKILKQYRPDYLAVVFDLKGPTFRHQLYPLYKATRPPAPEDLVGQIPRIREIITALGVAIVEKPGVEADDLIATIADREAGQNRPVLIASGDKDLLQLVSPLVRVVDTMNDRMYDEAKVRERFGVDPARVVDLLALTGDSTDNIPGVTGIGPKTAFKLIQEFGSLDELLANIGKIKNSHQRKLLDDQASTARLSRELVLVKKDVDLAETRDDLRVQAPREEALREIFKVLEFSTLLHQLKLPQAKITGEYQAVILGDDTAKLLTRIAKKGSMALEILADGPSGEGQILGFGVTCDEGEGFYIPWGGPPSSYPSSGEKDQSAFAWAKILADDGIKKYVHDFKNAFIYFAASGVEIKGLSLDTMLAAYLLNPTRRDFELADVARDHLDTEIPSRSGFLGEGARARTFGQMKEEERQAFAARRAQAVWRLAPTLTEKILAADLAPLAFEIELPLVRVLAKMEQAGVGVDRAALEKFSRELDRRLGAMEKKIHELAGERFNINSPKQLQVILFEKLKLSRGRKIKAGYSTDSDLLADLAQAHELPAEILAWRGLAKLKNTYVDALPLLINARTGRLHTSYNQTVTATGRLSSSNPNLQNIPIRSEDGRRIRRAFIAPAGWYILSADYSQIELRILAHLSQDSSLIATFQEGEDIHTRTAAEVFHIFPEMVSKEMRRQAKVINFGILYGMGPFSLSRELGVSQKQAEAYIEGYFRRYPRVKAYQEEVLDAASRLKYVTTLYGRRRYLPEITSSNAQIRQFACRTAINTPIQGTAADLIKKAMVKIDARMEGLKMKAKMIIQVHDELVFEVPPEEREELTRLVRKEMENVADLTVPLLVETAYGRNWEEAHT
jgi:DNA polymerase-1